MSDHEDPQFFPSGDQALVVEFGEEIDPEINSRVHRTAKAIDSAEFDGVIEVVPTYRSLVVHYNPLTVSFAELEDSIVQLSIDEGAESPTDRIVEIPTLYGGEYGLDLGFVAENAGMTEADVIRIHSGTDYLVYMMGFSPGFPYLGGLDPRLNTPRLQTPRTLIPAGSVGIAETQTGVYPVASPGGWQLIGRTPLRLFDPGSDTPTVINAGDRVRFVPLEDEDAFQAIDSQIQEGTYSVKTRVGR